MRSRTVRIALSVAVSAISLYLAIRQVSWGEVGQAFAQASWGWVGLAVLSVAVNILSKVIRWRLLASTTEYQASFGKLTAAFLTGQMLNSLYPGRVGDLGRAYVSGERATERAFMLGTIVIEKIFDLAAYAALAMVMVSIVEMPEWISGSITVLVSAGIFALAIIGSLWMARKQGISLLGWVETLRQRISQRNAGEKVMSWLREGWKSLEVLNRPQLLTGVVACTGILWATAWLTNLLVIQAFNLGFSSTGEEARAALVILLGLIAGISIPTPGRIGVFEFVCVLTLQLFMIPQALALSYGFLLHAVVFLPQTLGGLASMVALEARGGRIIKDEG